MVMVLYCGVELPRQRMNHISNFYFGWTNKTNLQLISIKTAKDALANRECSINTFYWPLSKTDKSAYIRGYLPYQNTHTQITICVAASVFNSFILRLLVLKSGVTHHKALLLIIISMCMNIYVQQYGSSCSTVILLRIYIAMKTKEAGHVIKTCGKARLLQIKCRTIWMCCVCVFQQKAKSS